MDLGLRGRSAIVTGASRGIGRACALALTAEGADVCAVARDQALLDDLATVAGPGRVVTASVDLRTEAGCDQAVAACVDAFGGVQVLVNNAGAAGMGNVLELSSAAVDDALLLKFHGYLRMSQRVAPHMVEAGWGRIVNIAGAAGTTPTAGNLPTSLANIAVLNLTRALSDQLAGAGVLVNAICPGATRTDRARALWSAAALAQGRDVEELMEDGRRKLPAGRIAEPEEVATVATFLASAACSYLFGSALYMEGGARRGTP